MNTTISILGLEWKHTYAKDGGIRHYLKPDGLLACCWSVDIHGMEALDSGLGLWPGERDGWVVEDDRENFLEPKICVNCLVALRKMMADRSREQLVWVADDSTGRCKQVSSAWEKIAKHTWPHACWVSGHGRYASLAHCGGNLTIQLYSTPEAAQMAKAVIDSDACGSNCKNHHEVVDLNDHQHHGRAYRPQVTELYRHYDINGVLLYVGISISSITRAKQHKAASGWWGEIVRIDIERFPNRKMADDAETVAIQTENPKYNVAKRNNHAGIVAGQKQQAARSRRNQRPRKWFQTTRPVWANS
jgi:hypothetical protein